MHSFGCSVEFQIDHRLERASWRLECQTGQGDRQRAKVAVKSRAGSCVKECEK